MKEVAAAALIVLSIALVRRVAGVRPPGGWIAVLGVAVAALLAVLSLGGVVWILPALAVAAGLLWGRLGAQGVLRRAGALATVVTALSLPLVVPALLDGKLLPPTSSSLTGRTAKGNLIEPLGLERLFGIWPAGDFRLDAVDGDVTAVLIAVVALAALLGLWYAVRSGGLGILLYGGGVLAACLFLVAIGSPWVDGKALATASPALLALAAAGGAAAISRGRRIEGGIVLAAIAAGVLWSNTLAYRDANLAPRYQLAELEEIGETIAGQGPTLMTEYQPYGARHFLREADPEAVSELRRRSVPLRSGGTVEKGFWADTDDLELGGLTVYRTLVLRRSPVQSRPPTPYALAFSGRYYEVWQRRPGPPAQISEHLPLGGGLHVAAPTRCDDVRRLVGRAGRSGTIAYEEEPPSVTLPASELTHPESWRVTGDRTLMPLTDGAASVVVTVPRGGTWQSGSWGSIRGRMGLLIDGQPAGSVRHLLNNAGLYASWGPPPSPRGSTRWSCATRARTCCTPAAGGRRQPARAAHPHPGRSRGRDPAAQRPFACPRLCGRRLDWVEALR